MAPALIRGIGEADSNMEKHIERQMGCMAGLLQIFDRGQFLNGKRVYTPKRLPSNIRNPPEEIIPGDEKTVISSGSQSPARNKCRAPVVVRSPVDIRDVVKNSVLRDATKTPEKSPHTPRKMPEKQSPTSRTPAVVDNSKVVEIKDGLMRSSWKTKEGPRLSLDSRAGAIDRRGGGGGGLFPREIRTSVVRQECTGELESEEDGERHRRSPSVVARLMGLEGLPGSVTVEPAVLRRSASESRASRMLIPNGWREEEKPENGRKSVGAPPKDAWKFQQSKGFEAAEVLPGDVQRAGNLYGEIERRLKMRGIDETGKDLETLKQILEALQLKGLLHSAKAMEDQQKGSRNFIFVDRKPAPAVAIESPMKPSKVPAPPPARRINGSESPPKFKGGNGKMPPAKRQTANEILPPPPKPAKQRSPTSPPIANDRNLRRPQSPPAVLPRSPGRRDSPGMRNSPPSSPTTTRQTAGRRTILDAENKSPRNRRRIDRHSYPAESLGKEDELSCISESSRSTFSFIDSEVQKESFQIQKKDEFMSEGRSLLDRCNKLLQSIAEVTEQSSPVSVLDSSFQNEDTSPSPVSKRSLSFKEDRFSPIDEPIQLQPQPSISYTDEEVDDAACDDYRYVADVVLASGLLQNTQAIGNGSAGSSAVFSFIESRQKNATTTSNAADFKSQHIHRRLIFDTVMEILQRKRHQLPTKASSIATFVSGKQLLRQVWSEFNRIRQLVVAEDVIDVVSGVINKDFSMPGAGWGENSGNIGDTVLDIERLIYKDLVAETIKDLAFLLPKPRASRRQLHFE